MFTNFVVYVYFIILSTTREHSSISLKESIEYHLVFLNFTVLSIFFAYSGNSVFSMSPFFGKSFRTFFVGNTSLHSSEISSFSLNCIILSFFISNIPNLVFLSIPLVQYL